MSPSPSPRAPPTPFSLASARIACRGRHGVGRRWNALLLVAVASQLVAATGQRGLGATAAMPLVEGEAPVRAELLVDAAALQPNDSGQMGVRLLVGRGWHVYAPDGFGVSAPTRVQFASLHAHIDVPTYPPPGLFSQFDGAGALGYSDEVVIAAPFAVDAKAAAAGGVELRASISLLACKILCVPGRFELRARVPIASVHRPATAKARTALARALAPAAAAPPSVAVAAAARPAATPPAVPPEARTPAAVRAQQMAKAANDAVADAALDAVLHARAADDAAGPAAEAPKLSQLPELETERAPAEALAKRGAASEHGGAGADARPHAETSGESGSLLGMLLAAFLGGLILNAMPCVLPVLAMKALSLASAHPTPAAARTHARAYVAGTVGSMLLLGLAALTLRELGQAAGWGFQMQQPAFLAGVAVALTLFVASSFEAVSFAAPVGGLERLHGRAAGPWRGVLEGTLAVLVATPCSAPFLAGAAAFALTQPAPVLLACFATIGLGLASPFVALASLPAARRFLPRPGPWMGSIKGGLGFALLGTLAWVLWLYAAVAGLPALASLLALVWLAAAGTAAIGKATQSRFDLVPLSMALWLVVLAVIGSEVLPKNASLAPARSADARAGARPAPAETQAGDLPSSPWSEAAVQAALAAGRPALVEFTAQWCVTCKYNERQLADPGVRAALARADVAVFVADWTHPDDAIYAALQAHGRAGVPMALLYDPRRPREPTRLSEVLRVADLLQRLRALPAGGPRGHL